MSNLHDSLVEHATFPFPQPNEDLSTSSADISPLEVPLLEEEWKAKHAVRDDTLVQKLCNTLKNILGGTSLTVDTENQFLSVFSPRIQQVGPFGQQRPLWRVNPNEGHSRFLLEKGVLNALEYCLCAYGQHELMAKIEQVARFRSGWRGRGSP
ncbi:hypothetical protein AX14_013942 [Amanita brunnescens Koide BX004]|nr:hypothetical protein AX14_013942 [Amanita brunnescens Koide BX004]